MEKENMSLWTCEEYIAEIERLKRELSAMTSERNEWKFHSGIEGRKADYKISQWKYEIAELKVAKAKATQRAELYRKALEEIATTKRGGVDRKRIAQKALEDKS